ncbi:hypothetical protein QW060_16315 [Myroides ceti]|uniref:Uncharacterized protein n=1 Tax=Paenimyroides ceti TaxID=395087 RepID=A0ABT8D031_9FLAO|nr:hypothetical protein [Paenimyroides ceti]MDN3708667.1 hypothetical protein [Paenimyroides ceti]
MNHTQLKILLKVLSTGMFFNDYQYIYESDGTKTMTDNYMYDLAFGPSYDNTPISTLSRGDGNADISQLYGNAVEAFKYDLPQGLQNTGDGMALAGYALTLSGAGAGIGAPIAAIGTGISTVGATIEVSVSIYDKDLDKAGTAVGFFIGGKVVEKGLNRVLPGAGKKVGEKGFNLGTEIITQGASLKTIGLQRFYNEKQENNKKK